MGNIACNLPVTGEGPLVETIPRNGFQWTVRVDQMFNHDKDRLYGVAFRTSRHATAYGELMYIRISLSPNPITVFSLM